MLSEIVRDNIKLLVCAQNYKEKTATATDKGRLDSVVGASRNQLLKKQY